MARRLLMALLTLSVTIIALNVSTRAQTENRAGLVVQFGDGSVFTRCVAFGEPEITGYELLQRSGLSIVADNAQGAFICKIDRDGCAFPVEPCACKYASEQRYWSYWILSDGAWRYSTLGASASRVQNGSVEGWVWSAGVDGSAAPTALPKLSVQEICAQNANPTQPASTATVALNPTVIPTSTPEPVRVRLETLTPEPTAVPVLDSTATLQSPVTASGQTPTPLQTPSQAPASAQTAARPQTPDTPVTQTPAPSPAATQLPASEQGPSRSSTSVMTAAPEPPTPPVRLTDASTATEAVIDAAIGVVDTDPGRTGTAAVTQVVASHIAAVTSAGPGEPVRPAVQSARETPAEPKSALSATVIGYIVFALLVSMLAATMLFIKFRR